MNKQIKNGIIFGISGGLTLLLIGISYAALSSVTATEGETLTVAKWDSLVEHAVPSKAVMAFYDTTCPDGWSKANGTDHALDLRGEFVRGLDDGRGIDSSRVMGSTQNEEFKSHIHGVPKQFGDIAGINNLTARGFVANYSYADANDALTRSEGGDETRPRNVALLYCVKD